MTNLKPGKYNTPLELELIEALEQTLEVLEGVYSPEELTFDRSIAPLHTQIESILKKAKAGQQ